MRSSIQPPIGRAVAVHPPATYIVASGSTTEQGPASRADLARASGLTRVTVSDLVKGNHPYQATFVPTDSALFTTSQSSVEWSRHTCGRRS